MAKLALSIFLLTVVAFSMIASITVVAEQDDVVQQQQATGVNNNHPVVQSQNGEGTDRECIRECSELYPRGGPALFRCLEHCW